MRDLPVEFQARCTECGKRPPVDWPEGDDWLCCECWRARVDRSKREAACFIAVLLVGIVFWLWAMVRWGA